MSEGDVPQPPAASRNAARPITPRAHSLATPSEGVKLQRRIFNRRIIALLPSAHRSRLMVHNLVPEQSKSAAGRVRLDKVFLRPIRDFVRVPQVDEPHVSGFVPTPLLIDGVTKPGVISIGGFLDFGRCPAPTLLRK